MPSAMALLPTFRSSRRYPWGVFCETLPILANAMPGRSERASRRRPFSTLMKKLANLKTSSQGKAGTWRAESGQSQEATIQEQQPTSGVQTHRAQPRHDDSQPSLVTARTGRTASASSISGRTSTDHEHAGHGRGAIYGSDRLDRS